jgi:hypothetical protein
VRLICPLKAPSTGWIPLALPNLPSYLPGSWRVFNVPMDLPRELPGVLDLNFAPNIVGSFLDGTSYLGCRDAPGIDDGKAPSAYAIPGSRYNQAPRRVPTRTSTKPTARPMTIT